MTSAVNTDESPDGVEAITRPIPSVGERLVYEVARDRVLARAPEAQGARCRCVGRDPLLSDPLNAVDGLKDRPERVVDVASNESVALLAMQASPSSPVCRAAPHAALRGWWRPA